MDAPLIDWICESCFSPEAWPSVLDEMGHITGAPGASLFVSEKDVLHWVASPEPRTRAERMVKEGWLWRGTIMARLFAQRHTGFLIDDTNGGLDGASGPKVMQCRLQCNEDCDTYQCRARSVGRCMKTP